MNRIYIVYDGRAEAHDTNNASVLEVLGVYKSIFKAKKEAYRHYSGTDAKLFSYQEKDKRLEDELYHGEIDLYTSVMMNDAYFAVQFERLVRR